MARHPRTSPTARKAPRVPAPALEDHCFLNWPVVASIHQACPSASLNPTLSATGQSCAVNNRLSSRISICCASVGTSTRTMDVASAHFPVQGRIATVSIRAYASGDQMMSPACTPSPVTSSSAARSAIVAKSCSTSSRPLPFQYVYAASFSSGDKEIHQALGGTISFTCPSSKSTCCRSDPFTKTAHPSGTGSLVE